MSNIYMQIPGVEGNVTAKNYQGWIRLNSFSKRNHRSNTMKVGKMADREGGTPEFSEIEVFKTYDNASNQLFEKSCVAKTIPQVVIHTFANDNDAAPQCKIELSDVLVSEHVLHVSEYSQPVESFQMSFSKIQFTYAGLDQNKKPMASNSVGYDLAKAQTV